ncbi:hypothetical protein [Fischerella sp. PCC 9605]|uniref:hypothetical protein n=1 Tax=Fischerella sp. PCC 9605 TaxID=1173024 RepID=UPI0004B817A1|nr:hypothetical protein [Fischerella sp. PCC 9605]
MFEAYVAKMSVVLKEYPFGYKTINMIRKRQVQKVAKRDIVVRVKFIADIFRVVA